MKFNLKIFLLGLVSFGLIFWISVSMVVPKVESSLKKEAVSQSFELKNICEDLNFEFNGRDCSISGTIYDEIHREKIVATIKSINGIRNVTDDLEVLQLALPELRIEKSGEPSNLIWKIEGVISDGPNAVNLQDVLAKTLSNNNQRSLSIELKKDSRTANTLPVEKINLLLSKTLEILPEVSAVEISENNFKLTAKTYSKERRDQVLEFARSHLGDAIDGIVDAIEILEPTDEPRLSITSENDDDLIVSGLLADASLKNRIVELIKQTNQELNLKDDIKVKDNVRSAGWGSSVVRIVPALIAEVNDLKLNVSSDAVEFSGTVLGDDKKDSIQTLANQSFDGKEGSFKLINELVVFVPPQKANLTMSLDQNGDLKLSGLLPEKKLHDQFLEGGNLIGDDKKINENILVEDNVDEAPWVDGMSKLIKPFVTSVQWGALSIHGDEVALEAEVSDPESGDILQALVENTFPLNDFKRVIQITVAEPVGPTDEDIMALEEAVTDTVIYFLTESYSLGSKDKAKLDKLAELFMKVPGSSLALLGHTDPYGNADYNRKLSKKRCDSVKSYLVESGINSLLLEVVEKGETEKVVEGRTYESGRRVEFELR